MLEARILSTLKFFDLQDYPLTLLEIHNFLLNDFSAILKFTDNKFELSKTAGQEEKGVSVDEVLVCLEEQCAPFVVQSRGFYALKGSENTITTRLKNYFFGIRREKLITRFSSNLRHVPFVRGAALAGSQALGLQKENSDIDLLVFTHPRYMFLARVLVSLYFQILGLRRHGSKITNRFCLNHYMASGKILTEDKNLYSAAEYIKLRPLAYSQAVVEFQEKNQGWIKTLFPNVSFKLQNIEKTSLLQKILENFLDNAFGNWLEKISNRIQHSRILPGEFIVVCEDELSFHPNNRKQELFRRFLEFEQQNQGETV